MALFSSMEASPIPSEYPSPAFAPPPLFGPSGSFPALGQGRTCSVPRGTYHTPTDPRWEWRSLMTACKTRELRPPRFTAVLSACRSSRMLSVPRHMACPTWMSSTASLRLVPRLQAIQPTPRASCRCCSAHPGALGQTESLTDMDTKLMRLVNSVLGTFPQLSSVELGSGMWTGGIRFWAVVSQPE